MHSYVVYMGRLYALAWCLQRVTVTDGHLTAPQVVMGEEEASLEVTI